jgi:hypothetical protein
MIRYCHFVAIFGLLPQLDFCKFDLQIRVLLFATLVECIYRLSFPILKICSIRCPVGFPVIDNMTTIALPLSSPVL